MKIFKKMAILALSFAVMGVFAQDEGEILAQYGAITIKKVTVDVYGQKEDDIVAVIDDSSDETPVITEDIVVDSVTYNRVFKGGVPSTLMLPFEVNTWQLGISAFEFVEVKKDCDPYCRYRVNVRTIYPEKIKANTPYVAIAEGTNDASIAFNKRYQNNGYVLNTTVNDRKYNYAIDDINWTFQGTYERIEFTNPKGIYGFAAKNKNDVKMGDFKRAACNDTSCAYIRPFRAYLKCTMSQSSQNARVLAKTVNVAAGEEISSLDDLPEMVEVYVIEPDSGTTYLGKVNTYTGEFVADEDRWFDMKGRKLDHKPTAKGTYYNNRKKVIVK